MPLAETTARRGQDTGVPADFSQELAEFTDSGQESKPAAPKKEAGRSEAVESQASGTGHSARKEKRAETKPGDGSKRRRPQTLASAPVAPDPALAHMEKVREAAPASGWEGGEGGGGTPESGETKGIAALGGAAKAIAAAASQTEAAKPSKGEPLPAPEIPAVSNQLPEGAAAAAPGETQLAFAARLAQRKDTPAPNIAKEAPAATGPASQDPDAGTPAAAKVSTLAPPASAKGRTQPSAEEPESSGKNSAETRRPAEAPREAARPATAGPASAEARINVSPAAPVRMATPDAVPQPAAKPVASATAVPEPLVAPDSPAAPRSDTVRDLSLRLSDNGRERIEVRLTEQAGEVKVAVHASDSDLRRGLRDGLSDLVGRLEGSGFQAEAWRPQETSFGRQNSSSQQQTPDGGGSGQGQNRGRNPDSQQQQPKWVEEMEQRFRQTGSPLERKLSWLQQSIR